MEADKTSSEAALADLARSFIFSSCFRIARLVLATASAASCCLAAKVTTAAVAIPAAATAPSKAGLSIAIAPACAMVAAYAVHIFAAKAITALISWALIARATPAIMPARAPLRRGEAFIASTIFVIPDTTARAAGASISPKDAARALVDSCKPAWAASKRWLAVSMLP